MKSFTITLILALAAVFTLVFVAPVIAVEDKPADNMPLLLEKIKTDKKVLVATNMDLTEKEAKAFWPIYDEYQKELASINQRIGQLIASYATDYRANTLTNEKASKLSQDLVTIEKTDGGLQASFIAKLNKVLPAIKVARYLQIEHKIKAAKMWALANEIPLVM